jgi:hypothetical protein
MSKFIPCFASPVDEGFIALIRPLFVFDVAYELIKVQ